MAALAGAAVCFFGAAALAGFAGALADFAGAFSVDPLCAAFFGFGVAAAAAEEEAGALSL